MKPSLSFSLSLSELAGTYAPSSILSEDDGVQV